MPVIQITLGKISKEQKRELIEKITKTAIEITKIPANEFTVSIIELDHDNIGRAGKTLSDTFAAKK
jgi:4-oxalocrotonate tautomerase